MGTEREYFLGLDLGTETIRAIAMSPDNQSGLLSVLAVASGPSQGIRRGNILDGEETASALSAVLEQIERSVGGTMVGAGVNVNGSHLNSILSQGTVAVSRPDGEIVESDTVRAMEAARAVSMTANREILHVLPKAFAVDGQGGIPNPIGNTGVRLEVEACLITAGSANLKQIQKLCVQTGVGSPTLTAGGIAAAQTALTARQKELGCVLIDIGAGTTGVTIFEEGGVLHLSVIPMGGLHITNDLAIGLRCHIDTAERVKKLHGSALLESLHNNELIDLQKINPEESGRVEKREVVKIIEARTLEILEHVGKALKTAGRYGQLPAGAILVGGSSNLPGIVNLTKDTLKLPAMLASQNEISQGQYGYDLEFATAIGLAKLAGQNTVSKSSRLWKLLPKKHLGKLKSWADSLLP